MSIVNWLALLLAPSLALTTLMINYASVTPACEQQSNMELHLVAAVSLALCLLFSWLAWRNLLRRRATDSLQQNSSHTPNRQCFVAKVAVMVGLLSSLVIFAQWLPIWILSPCVA
jgi:hypothetical protein